jgi:hypothetical protein
MADTIIITDAIGNNSIIRVPKGPFWISPTEGLLIYTESGDLRLAKTTDAFVTVPLTGVEAEAGTLEQVGTWADFQTPGRGGDKVHVVSLDTTGNDFDYWPADISDGAWGSKVEINGSAGVNATNELNICFITITSNGTFYAGYATGTASAAYKSTNQGANWSTIANPFEAHAGDHCIPVLVDTGDNSDFGLLVSDIDSDTLEFWGYDASLDTWVKTDVVSGLAWNATWIGFNTKAQRTTRLNYVAYFTEFNTATADLETATLSVTDLSSPVWTAKGNVLTDTTGATAATVMHNPLNDDIYVGYVKGTVSSLTNCFYKKSTNGMTSFGGEVQFTVDTADDYRSLGASVISQQLGGLLTFIVYDDDDDQLRTNLDNDFPVSGVADPSTIAHRRRNRGIYY